MENDLMEQAYREYAQTVYRFLLTKTGNADLAEELTQETFFQAVKSCGRFNGSCKISTWLIAIAKNVLLSNGKKIQNEPLPEEAALSGNAVLPSAEDTVLGKMNGIALMRRLHVLPVPMREVMYLRLSGDLSFRDIGEILDRTENWARVTYFRGKEKLLEEG